MIHTDAGYYTPVPPPSGSGNPTYMHVWYLKDHLGNNRVFADGTGTALRNHHYDPFGESITLTGATQSPFPTGATESPYKYGEKEWSDATSTYDFEARQFSPNFHRFTTMDPLCEKYYGISPYAYCLNNPTRFIDPLGLTSYIVDGEERVIDDGCFDTMELSTSEFSLLYYWFIHDMNEYGTRRQQYMDQYGYVDSDANLVLPAVVVSGNAHESQSKVSEAWGMGSSASSLALSIKAESRYSKFLDGWIGPDGQYYYLSTKGAGKHFEKANRTEVFKYSRMLKRSGRALGYLSAVFDINDLRVAYQRGDSQGIILEVTDLVLDGVGFLPYCCWIPVIWNFGVRSYVESRIISPSVGEQTGITVIDNY